MSEINLSENVISRALALVTDNFIILFTSLVISLPIGLLWGLITEESISTTMISVTLGLVLLLPVIPILLSPIYFTLLEGRNGKTLGKSMMGLKVIKNSDSSEISYLRAFARHLIDPFASLFLWIPSLIVIYITKGRRIGDLIAGTKVVKSSEK